MVKNVGTLETSEQKVSPTFGSHRQLFLPNSKFLPMGLHQGDQTVFWSLYWPPVCMTIGLCSNFQAPYSQTLCPSKPIAPMSYNMCNTAFCPLVLCLFTPLGKARCSCRFQTFQPDFFSAIAKMIRNDTNFFKVYWSQAECVYILALLAMKFSVQPISK